MKRKESTIHYCSQCRMTTAHAVAGEICTCKRCGGAKTLQPFRMQRKHDTHSLTHLQTDYCMKWN